VAWGGGLAPGLRVCGSGVGRGEVGLDLARD
jgi:hypothetical protein